MAEQALLEEQLVLGVLLADPELDVRAAAVDLAGLLLAPNHMSVLATRWIAEPDPGVREGIARSARLVARKAGMSDKDHDAAWSRMTA